MNIEAKYTKQVNYDSFSAECLSAVNMQGRLVYQT